MKWFQVDSDTPNDPRIRAVIREMGCEGFGGLVRLWCYVADHGHVPGRSIDSSGRPFPEADLLEASGLCAEKFSQLVTICTGNGHFRKKAWDDKRELNIPAMSKRADTYSKRKLRTK